MAQNKFDIFTIVVRFVFGFIFGAVAGYFFMSTLIIESQQQLIDAALIIGAVFGIIAIIWGDKFWLGLKNRFWW